MDNDDDINNKLLTKQTEKDIEKSLRASKSSFRSAANEIMNASDKVKEGRIPLNEIASKRRTVQGIRPEGYEPSTRNDQRKSISKERTSRKSQLQNERTVSNKKLQSRKSVRSVRNTESKEKEDEENNDDPPLVYKQDILTKQAIDEVRDNIEMFKMDINRYVTELREQQEKIELGDVKTEIKFLEETLTKDLKATRDQNDGDFRIIKEAFLLFKEEVFQIINKIVKDNEFKIEELYNEIKIYEDEINKRFVQLSDRQDEYINTLKLIFETTTDKRTKQLVEQFLIDDEEVYLANKERFEKEFNERREAEKKSLEEKEREMLEIKLRTQQKIIDEAEKDNKELEQLEQEVKMRENQILSKKEEELINKYEEMQKEREDADYQNQIKLEENLFKYYSRREKENYRKLLKAQKKFMRTRPKEKEPESTERTK